LRKECPIARNKSYPILTNTKALWMGSFHGYWWSIFYMLLDRIVEDDSLNITSLAEEWGAFINTS
jgi:hypothetical protein